MTPYELEVLIWIHSRGDAWPPGRDTPMYQATVNRFLELDVIKPFDKPIDKLYLTDLGRHWLSMILETPLPEVRYVDPRFNDKIFAAESLSPLDLTTTTQINGLTHLTK